MGEEITKDTQVEEIIREHPEAVSYFIQMGVSPISCSGAFPATLGTLLEIKRVDDADGFIRGLNEFLNLGKQKKA